MPCSHGDFLGITIWYKMKDENEQIAKLENTSHAVK